MGSWCLFTAIKPKLRQQEWRKGKNSKYDERDRIYVYSNILGFFTTGEINFEYSSILELLLEF